MKERNKRVLVGMSGGIDSTATCLMLQERGYEIVGVTMRVWGDEPQDARELAAQMGIEHYVADERIPFKETIVKNFIDEYKQGRTPNPCVMCNPLFKFRVLTEWADKLGCAWVATGHYSRLEERNGDIYIVAGDDDKKDQSYFLWQLGQDVLRRCIFPLGDYTKVKVREYLADKGYDVKNIYNQVQELYQGECIIPLNKRSTKNPKLLPQGNPVCDAGLAMWKDGKFSDNGRTRQKFCCPLKSSKDADCPCHHKNFYNGKKHRGCTKYITIPDDLRLSVDRDSKYFKSNYSLRTECERYNSRFKNTGQERMWVRNKSSVTNLNTIAHISLLVVAVAAITTGTGQSYRKLKDVKRIV